MSEAKTCRWCGKELVGKRAHAEYCDSSCRGKATHWRHGSRNGGEKALGSATPPPIAAIREQQEAEKSRWSAIVHEAIIDCFRQRPTEPFHADDLEHIGIPDEHRNIIGSQIAKLVNQRWIVECGRRKSAIPSRNGAKSNEYRLTELGTRHIAGVGAGVPASKGRDGSARARVSASTDSGDRHAHGIANPEGPDAGCRPQVLDRPGVAPSLAANGAGSSHDATQGESPAGDQGRGSEPAGEPVPLFEDRPPSMYDPHSEAA